MAIRGVEFGLAAACIALAGCSPPEIDVDRQWRETMSRLGMYGIFPLSEDVQPGDVFLTVPAEARAQSREPRFNMIRLGSVETSLLLDRMQQRERQRLRIRFAGASSAQPGVSDPATGGGSPRGSSAGTPSGQGGTSQAAARPVRLAAAGDAAPTGVGPTGPTRPAAPRSRPTSTPATREPDVHEVGSQSAGPRLRRIAIPGIQAATITEAQLGAAGIFGNIGASLGIAGSQSQAVRISFRNLMALGLDQTQAEEMLRKQRTAWLQSNLRPRQLVDQLLRLDRTAARALCGGNSRYFDDRNILIVIANQVIYAGNIEYEFERSSRTAAALQLELARVMPTGRPGSASVPNYAYTAPENAQPASGATASNRLTTSEVAQIRRLLGSIAANTPTTPGANVSVGIGRFGGVSLTYTESPPVAVGIGAPIYFEVPAALVATGKDVDEAQLRLDTLLRRCWDVLNTGEEAFVPYNSAPGIDGVPHQLIPLLRLTCDATATVLRDGQDLAREEADFRRGAAAPDPATQFPRRCGQLETYEGRRMQVIRSRSEFGRQRRLVP